MEHEWLLVKIRVDGKVSQVDYYSNNYYLCQGQMTRKGWGNNEIGNSQLNLSYFKICSLSLAVPLSFFYTLSPSLFHFLRSYSFMFIIYVCLLLIGSFYMFLYVSLFFLFNFCPCLSISTFCLLQSYLVRSA